MKDKLTIQLGWLFRILTIIFVVLKLEGTIDWTWWWIISPMLLQAGILAIGCIILGIVWILKQLK